MIAELGHFCVILAFTISIVQILLKPISIRCGAVITTLLIIASLSLIWSFYTKDFSVKIISQSINYFDHISAAMLLGITMASIIIWKIKPSINITRLGAIITAAAIGYMLIEYNPFIRINSLTPMIQEIEQ